MIEDDGPLGLTGLTGLTVPLVGAVQATEDPFEPYRLTDPAGEPVSPVMTLSPAPNEMRRSSMIANFWIRSSRSMGG